MIDKNLILSLTDGGLEVFRHYLPPFQLRKNFKNPFYEDRRASCNVFFDRRHQCWRFHDFGDPSYSGDCFWLVSKIYGLDLKTHFVDVLKKIAHDLSLGLYEDDEDDVFLRKAVYDLWSEPASQEVEEEPKEEPEAQPYCYAEMPWSDNTLVYWSQYGIGEETLQRYDVVAIEDFSSYSRAGKFYTVRWTAREPLYGYNLGEGMKLYRPKSKRMKFLYAGRVPSPYIFGLAQLPEEGERVIITGGEKDVLSLATRGYSAICFNSETKSLPKEVLEELSSRFNEVAILYDMDETGIRSSRSVVVEYPDLSLRRIELPISGTKRDKDVSDFLRGGSNDTLLHQIISNHQ